MKRFQNISKESAYFRLNACLNAHRNFNKLIIITIPHSIRMKLTGRAVAILKKIEEVFASNNLSKGMCAIVVD